MDDEQTAIEHASGAAQERPPESGREWDGSRLVVAFVVFVVVVATAMILVRAGAGGAQGGTQGQNRGALDGQPTRGPVVMAAQQSDIGGGKIDNFIISPSVHRANGALVVVSLLAAAVWLSRLALKRQALDRVGLGLVVASQVFLAVQVLLGIKLLDQGMGVAQLYIHYVGGLIPLGLYFVVGWIPLRDPVRRARVLAVLVDIGLVAAVMAYAIGQAYVNRG